MILLHKLKALLAGLFSFSLFLHFITAYLYYCDTLIMHWTSREAMWARARGERGHPLGGDTHSPSPQTQTFNVTGEVTLPPLA